MELSKENLDVIGYMAGFLTTVAWWPQVMKTWKTKNVDGLSLMYYLILTIGLALWLVYGVAVGLMTLIIPNAISLVASIYITWQIAYGRHSHFYEEEDEGGK